MKIKVSIIALIMIAFVGCNNEKIEVAKITGESTVEQVQTNKGQMPEIIVEETEEG